MVRRLTWNFFLVLLFAWLTLFPTIAPLPVIAHLLAIINPSMIKINGDYIEKISNYA